ncbi:MAG: putative cytosolic protein [Rhodospirillales bacterium]|nr:putative cytosolic protein [Rhodospirillales bacterium]
MEIWTIGYEKAAQSDVIAALARAGIKTVLDVRDRPQSRRAGFSKTALAASLQAEGIGYVHLKPLGTPKEGRVAHHTGDHATFWRIVDTQLATPAAGEALEEVAVRARSERCCLLCYEADWRHCHRARIVDRLGADAHHLEAVAAFL